MIYQDIKRYLKRNYQTPSKDYEWSGHDNFKLLNYMQDRYSDEEISNNASEIKQAFRDFFEPISGIIVRFKPEKGIAYKIIPYHVQPKNSKHLQEIIDIIRQNRRSIEYPYMGREDQIAILGKIRRKINAIIAETDESVNKKDLVRYAIKQALELDERDVVVHLKRKYIIKLFKKNTLLNPDAKEPTEQEKGEKRSQGYNEDDLSEHYDELIADIDMNSFIDSTMQLLFSKELNFETITNSFYEKNVLSLIKNKIAQELKFYVSENDDYLAGFAEYILRKNFEKVHEKIALELFEQLVHKNKNAENFLRYYSGKTIIEDNKKYIIPSITTNDDKQWNITSIISISTSWQNTINKLKKVKIELKNIDKAMALISEEPDSNAYQLNRAANRNSNLQSSREYSELKNKKTELENEAKILSENLHINNSSYTSILSSIVKALMKRKKLLATV